ncbi:hypothetical protein BN134_3623 [Cronobacter dublinensis 1210]|uniref:Uncharacterized protein n=1 Tax=Cronobacter dublinensis 1210 TaxID=1208656 RepID=A0ABP1WBP4_9ENTR|nr:hypothetical protein BN134_3623 [Cronobacter dublinensis 1210]
MVDGGAAKRDRKQVRHPGGVFKEHGATSGTGVTLSPKLSLPGDGLL